MEDKNEQTQPKEEKIEEKKEKSIIEEAELIALRIETANKRQEELIKKQEGLFAQQLLSGHTIAGQQIIKKELTPQEYAKEVLEGKRNPFIDDNFIKK